MFKLKFNENNVSFKPKFDEVIIVADGGYWRGYAEGFQKGYEQGSPELWNNNAMVMSDGWIKDNTVTYNYRNMGLTQGRYRFAVKENLATKGKLPSDVTGTFAFYISTQKGNSSGYLFANTTTTSHMTELVWEVAEGQTWYFNIYPKEKQDILFTRLLIGASLKKLAEN